MGLWRVKNWVELRGHRRSGGSFITLINWTIHKGNADEEKSEFDGWISQRADRGRPCDNSFVIIDTSSEFGFKTSYNCEWSEGDFRHTQSGNIELIFEKTTGVMNKLIRKASESSDGDIYNDPNSSEASYKIKRKGYTESDEASTSGLTFYFSFFVIVAMVYKRYLSRTVK